MSQGINGKDHLSKMRAGPEANFPDRILAGMWPQSVKRNFLSGPLPLLQVLYLPEGANFLSDPFILGLPQVFVTEASMRLT